MRNRRKICAGNWKLYKSPSESRAFLSEWTSMARPAVGVEVVIFPPAYNLFVFSEKASEAHIHFGAQNIWHKKEGAFTGELSPEVVRTFGATYALIGHSERRQIFYETDELVAQKVEAALQVGLVPMICIGETLEERQSGKTENVLRKQLRGALVNVGATLKSDQKQSAFVVAYEPVWAIGTGEVATPEQAQEAHLSIRRELKELVGSEDVAVLYGGSVKPENAKGLISQPDIDGFLIGGASLKPSDLRSILSVF